MDSPQSLGRFVTWLPDNRELIVARRDKGPFDIWIVPVDGGAPRKTELSVADLQGGIRLHPDGRQITFSAGQGRSELWTLENFLPALPATK